MMRFLALWLAEWSDRWARRLTFDDGPEQLAAAEEQLEVWEVDRGDLLDRTFYADVIYMDEVDLAVRRHPAYRAKRR